jgi:hypothetical protein
MNPGPTAELAAAAARLIVEEGMEYGPAKRKAARLLGKHSVRAGQMPSNDAVEDEVRDYIAVFCADTQPAELAALRRLAMSWMDRLQAYRPHLTGAAWRGTATHLSSLYIDLYCDDAKAAEIEMINQGIDYEAHALTTRDGREPQQVLTVSSHCGELDERVTLHLTVRDLDELRGALKPDAQGRTLRGDLKAVQRLLQAPPSAPASVQSGGAA